MDTCAVCKAPGRKRRGYKRILCDDCAAAARGSESYRREIVMKSPEGWLKEHGHKPADGGIDRWEDRRRETLE